MSRGESKLSADELLRLVHHIMRLRARRSGVMDGSAYQRRPVGEEEFSQAGEDPLSWDAEGWENVQ